MHLHNTFEQNRTMNDVLGFYSGESYQMGADDKVYQYFICNQTIIRENKNRPPPSHFYDVYVVATVQVGGGIISLLSSANTSE